MLANARPFCLMKVTLDHNCIIHLQNRTDVGKKIKAIVQDVGNQCFVVDIGASEMRKQGVRPDHYEKFEDMRNNGRQARCENCGRTGVQVRPVTRSYGRGATLLVIEKVPVTSCPHCGASYLTAKTLHEIARIKLHRRSVSRRRSVAVAEFVSPQETG